MSKRLTMAIERVLRRSTDARDSDNELIVCLLQAEGAYLTPHQVQVVKSFNFESITRARRKLQEAGQYMPSPEVARQRRLKSYIVQQNAPTAKPVYLQELIEAQPEPLPMPTVQAALL